MNEYTMDSDRKQFGLFASNFSFNKVAKVNWTTTGNRRISNTGTGLLLHTPLLIIKILGFTINRTFYS